MAVAQLAPRTTRPAVSRPIGARPRLHRLTPKLRAAVLEMISKGVPISTAAVACGIPRRTFFDWLSRGRVDDPPEPYRSFAIEVDEAQEMWAAHAVCRIDAAGDKDYRALTWLLERKKPEEWSDPNRHGDTIVNVGVIVESPEWQALSERLMGALAGYPDALDAVIAEMGGQVVAGEAVEVKEISS